MGKTLAFFIWLGNYPEFMLLFIRTPITGERQLAAIFIILGPMPSKPVALEGSREFIMIGLSLFAFRRLQMQREI